VTTLTVSADQNIEKLFTAYIDNLTKAA
jgi:hypothetical protein